MHHTVVLITGSEPLDAVAVSSLPIDATLIAADGGLDHARAAGLSPGTVIGDLDSITPDGLAWAEEHAAIHRHPAGKDLTDTELALAEAARQHPERLILVAGDGDRLDHTLAAIGALGAPELTSIPVIECWWGAQFARVIHGPARTHLVVGAGARVSVLALHGQCNGVTLTGTRWELDRDDLEPLVGRGVSNVAEDDELTIEVSQGIVTIFVDPPAPVTGGAA